MTSDEFTRLLVAAPAGVALPHQLTTKQLQRGSHDSVAELTADINNWVEQWNLDPKPFVWHKTADEILERLAGYCTQITEQNISTESA